MGKVHTGVFSKDLPWLMYGFGDADKPLKVGWGAVSGSAGAASDPAAIYQQLAAACQVLWKQACCASCRD